MSRAWSACTWAAALLAATLLSACGGGGGDDGTAIPATAIPDNISISSAASSDVGEAAAFSNSAAALQGLSFSWDFGDGSSGSTAASPTHDYAKVGDYEVTLKVSNTGGQVKEVKFRISVNNRAHVRGLACSGVSESGWCWQQPRPTGTVPDDFFFLDAQTGWSVGDSGEILKTIDGGKTWSKQPTGIRTRLWSVRFADANNGWAIGAYGAVLRTSDGGASWVLQEAGFLDGYGVSLYAISARTAVISSSNGRVRVTEDGGASWSERNFKLDAVGRDGVLWGLAGNALKRSADLGRSSTDIAIDTSVYSYKLQALNDGAIVLSGVYYSYDSSTFQSTYQLRIQRSLDSGGTWERYDALGLPRGWINADAVTFANASTATWATGSEAYRSTDAGRNWTRISGPTGNFSISEKRVLDGGNIYVGAYGYATGLTEHYLSEDGGATWRRITSAFTYTLGSRVQHLGAQAWLSISGDAAALSTDGMQSWSIIGGVDPNISQRSMTAVWFFDAKHGLGLNAAGELQETVNGGLDWSVKLKDLSVPSYGVARFQFASASKGWLLAGDGKIYRSTDGGALWSTPLAGRSQISSFHFVDENNGFAVGRDYSDTNLYNGKPVLLVSTDGGQSWNYKADFVDGITGIHFATANKGVAIGTNGRILSTEDGGLSWGNRFSAVSSTLNRLVFTDASTAWVVGDNGTLLKSLDGGVSWNQVLTGNSAALRSIQFLDAQRGWIVGSGGTILSTQDGGKTWTPQFSGTQQTLNELFFVDSRTGWVLGNQGTILATGTGGF
jgi:photosystem II stability/assembly factor-like uncharacterized protein